MVVQSIDGEMAIDVKGFELAEPDRHMMAWIRRGTDFPAFVVSDVAEELCAQDAEARLLSLTLTSKPVIETKLRQSPVDPAHGIVTAVAITLPIQLQVVSGVGDTWMLEVAAVYRAAHMDVPDEFSLNFDFNVISSAGLN